jgi:uncharacterized Zn finger protein
MWYDFKPYVPVAERRRQAMREMEKLRKKGHPVSPVVIEGRAIASTFWGKAWCDNLERYSDYASRLPRGRTYVRNGSVVDLQIEAGAVNARVSGSELYKVKVRVAPVAKARWSAIRKDCSGSIDSLVELLQGRFSKGVMERICQQTTGLFPSPREIELDCSCPDWAWMCKHVAAVLYGIGARLDEKPELLFRLRNVDEKELVAHVGAGVPLATKGPATAKVLDGGDLAALFGIEMAAEGKVATKEKAKGAVRALPKRPASSPTVRTGGRAGAKRSTRKTSPGRSRKPNGQIQ